MSKYHIISYDYLELLRVVFLKVRKFIRWIKAQLPIYKPAVSYSRDLCCVLGRRVGVGISILSTVLPQLWVYRAHTRVLFTTRAAASPSDALFSYLPLHAPFLGSVVDELLTWLHGRCRCLEAPITSIQPHSQALSQWLDAHSLRRLHQGHCGCLHVGTFSFNDLLFLPLVWSHLGNPKSTDSV